MTRFATSSSRGGSRTSAPSLRTVERTTIVWVGLDGNDVVIGRLRSDQKAANIARDPRVTSSIEADDNQWGMQFHLIIEGVARVSVGGAPALLHDFAQRYLGPGTRFPPMPDPPVGFVIHFTPTKIRGLGPCAPMPTP